MLERASGILPKLEYDGSVKSPDCPYGVALDLPKTVDLFKLAGVKEEDIPRITINIARRAPSLDSAVIKVLYKAQSYANYNRRNRTISLYFDRLWSIPDSSLEDINARANISFIHEAKHAGDHSLGKNYVIDTVFKTFYHLISGKRGSLHGSLKREQRAIETTRQYGDSFKLISIWSKLSGTAE